VRCQLCAEMNTTRMDTTSLSEVASISGSGPDEFALELGTTEDRQNQAAVRSGRVATDNRIISKSFL
jgi:hypothetical protein